MNKLRTGETLYSIENIINGTTSFEKIKQALITSNQAHFSQLIDEALLIIFGNNNVDIEIIEALHRGLEEVSIYGVYNDSRMNDEYYHIDQILFTQTNNKLSKLIHQDLPAIDSPYLALYSINLSITVLNDHVQQSLYIYKEAIEALSIARYSSAYLDLCDSLYVEIHRDRLKKEYNIKKSQRLKAIKKAKDERVMRDKYAKKVYQIAEKVWQIEPYVPIGILADEINQQMFVNSDAYSRGYLKMESSKLIKAFKTYPNTPSTAVITGPPSKLRKQNKHLGKSFIDFVPELVKFNLVSL
ncbi:hypothetical protein [Colwellia sp. Bg11-12]|uniref:hypothetical protein n=1 Tax=Colwellia sp. Bg11-12 TaxID=2759817 RepID=UPI0015F46339|nr:hypothetical protein [Colwellia sp. Bg11-12]MBA6264289.1 hypothetical protein [Colwellia sp. Bg11-12]